MGAAFTGHLQDRMEAQGRAPPVLVVSLCPVPVGRSAGGGVGGWVTSCSPPAWPTTYFRIFKISSFNLATEPLLQGLSQHSPWGEG